MANPSIYIDKLRLNPVDTDEGVVYTGTQDPNTITEFGEVTNTLGDANTTFNFASNDSIKLWRHSLPDINGNSKVRILVACGASGNTTQSIPMYIGRVTNATTYAHAPVAVTFGGSDFVVANGKEQWSDVIDLSAFDGFGVGATQFIISWYVPTATLVAKSTPNDGRQGYYSKADSNIPAQETGTSYQSGWENGRHAFVLGIESVSSESFTDGKVNDIFIDGSTGNSYKKIDASTWDSIPTPSTFSGTLSNVKENDGDLTFVAGSATLDMSTCENVQRTTLTEASALTLTNLTKSKPLVIYVAHSGGPWTLSINSSDLGLVGSAGELEAITIDYDGTNIQVWRGGVVDVTI